MLVLVEQNDDNAENAGSKGRVRRPEGPAGAMERLLPCFQPGVLVECRATITTARSSHQKPPPP